MAITTENLQFELSRFEGWAKTADVKIGAILALEGVLLPIMVKHTFMIISDPRISYLTQSVYIVSSILFLWSVGKVFWAISPKLNHNQGTSSPLYFRDVSRVKLQSYKQTMTTLTTTQYRQEIIAQMHAVAKVAEKRMVAFRDAVFLLVVSLLITGGVEAWLRLSN